LARFVPSIDKELKAVTADYRNVIEKDLAAFNRSHTDRGITPVVGTSERTKPSN
jgi:hypothetical protein